MKTLLLNSTYQPISFISEDKVLKFFVKGKINIISYWEKDINWKNGSIKLPAIVQLKYYVRWLPRKSKFSKINICKRDNFTCQYCAKKLKISEVTLDHVLPKSQGGKLHWKNVVTACHECNSKKGNKSLKQVNMKLIKQPIIPKLSLKHEMYLLNTSHPDWEQYLY